MKVKSIVLMSVILVAHTVLAEEDKSIGSEAGKAARDMQSTLEQTYLTINKKAEETSQKIGVIAGEALAGIKDDLSVAYDSYQEKLKPALEGIQKEWQDFQEAYRENADTKDPADFTNYIKVEKADIEERLFLTQAIIDIRNISDKHITYCEISLEYLDAQGRKVSEDRFTIKPESGLAPGAKWSFKAFPEKYIEHKGKHPSVKGKVVKVIIANQ